MGKYDLLPRNATGGRMSTLQRFVCAALIASSAASLSAKAGTLTTLYSFGGGAGNPSGPLTYQSGELYGTTLYGAGIVFKINAKTQRFKVVYAFQGAPDGSSPQSGVVFENGVFYGTTFFGGKGCKNSHPIGCGTVFSVNAKSGVESVLYDFSESPNNGPVGAGELYYLSGTLYGITTYAGDENGEGSFFSFNPSTGNFATLSTFGGANGVNPNPQFLYQNGMFYGTTLYGGEGVCNLGGCGTLFSINPGTGAETVLRSFGRKDGKYPTGALAYHAGSFFGDTEVGGNQVCQRGCGVSFKVSAATGSETVLEDFENRGEGYSALTVVGGNAYETLPTGGSGNGQLIEVNLKSGQQTVLYTFGGGADGRYPRAALTYHDGTLYGTTMSGGKYGCLAGDGCGTVFKFVP